MWNETKNRSKKSKELLPFRVNDGDADGFLSFGGMYRYILNSVCFVESLMRSGNDS